jgi:hypothetical protein
LEKTPYINPELEEERERMLRALKWTDRKRF